MRAAVICLAVSATVPVMTAADTINVPGDAPTIQAGIDMAMNGDVVLVGPGVWVESLDLAGKAITLQGQGSTSVINPGALGAAIVLDDGEGADTVITGFKFTGGQGFDALGDGLKRGGAVVMLGASATFTDCTFDENTADTGGAMYVNGGSPQVSHCSFSSNFATAFNGIGGALHVQGATMTLDHVGFFTNEATDSFSGAGGAVAAEQSTLTMVECHLHGNISETHGGAIYGQQSTLSITATPFHVNEAVLGGAISWLNGPYELIDCLIYGSEAQTIGGAINAQHADGLIVGCDIAANTAGNIGGAFFAYASETVVRGTFFSENTSVFMGGAISVLEGQMDIANSVFAKNMNTGMGGAINNQQTAMAIANSTFVDNIGENGGAVFASDGIGTTAIANSIFRGEAPIGGVEGGVLSAVWSNVEGGFDGVGNIDADPMFVDAAEGDYRLMPGSNSADAGSNSLTPRDVVTDVLGRARFADDPAAADVGDGEAPIVDMGAHETPACGADCNADGSLNALDFVCFQNAWVSQSPEGDCDGDGAFTILDFVCYQAAFMAGCE